VVSDDRSGDGVFPSPRNRPGGIYPEMTPRGHTGLNIR
jgi:hypothetical protein